MKALRFVHSSASGPNSVAELSNLEEREATGGPGARPEDGPAFSGSRVVYAIVAKFRSRDALSALPPSLFSRGSAGSRFARPYREQPVGKGSSSTLCQDQRFSADLGWLKRFS